MVIEDVMGKPLKALTVFSVCIGYLKDDALSTVMKSLTGSRTELRPEDILWVLTVPAIWSDAAKHFMREAAQNKC